MSHAYTPGLRVTNRTKITKKRILPLKGDVVVAVGDMVSPDTVVARTEIPGPVEPLNVANILGVPPEVAKTLSAGDEIVVQSESAGTTVARGRAIASGADPRTRTVEVRADLPADWPTGVSVTALCPGPTA